MKKALRYSQDKTEHRQQSYNFLSLHLELLLLDGKSTVFAFTSSNTRKDEVLACIEKLAETFRRTHKTLIIISETTPGDGIRNGTDADTDFIPLDDVISCIDAKRANYEAIFVLLPPVHLWAGALKAAACADHVLLTEQYGCSRYSDFEQTLDTLRQHGILVNGIITHK